MTWRGWIVVAVAVLAAFAGGWALCRSGANAAAQKSADSLAVVQQAAKDSAIARGVQLAQRDSALRADSIQRVADHAKHVADSVARVAAHDSTAIVVAQLAGARTAADSVPIYRDVVVPALQAELATADQARISAEVEARTNRQGWNDQIAKTVLLEADTTSAGAVIASQRAFIARQAAQLAVHVMPSAVSKLGSFAETSAITAASAGACAHKLLSAGCIAGAAETIYRVVR